MSSEPTTDERILWELEKIREALQSIASAQQHWVDGKSNETVAEPPEQEPEPLSNQQTPIETLQTHMMSHDVDTSLVEMEQRDGEIWFKEVWEEMDSDDVKAFREYTMDQDHVEVDAWVERNENNYPDGFVVDLDDAEGLI